MTDDRNDEKRGAAREVHLGPSHKKFSWLPWLLLALGLLALLLFLTRSCSHRDAVPVTTTTTATTTTNTAEPAPGASAVAATDTAPVSQRLGDYLKGNEAAPRTFQLDKPHFDTGKSVVRDEDKPGIAELAGVLKQYGTAKVKLVGYADTRGSDPANAKLGADRAAAIKAALVSNGIAADRIATGSGGDQDPVATNGTAAGQAENRRTEIVVVSR